MTPLRRPPTSVFLIVSAVSWPGVTMTTAETPRKAKKCAITAPVSQRALLSGLSLGICSHHDGPQLRCHGSSGPAIYAADRADAEGGRARVRIRLDLRLAHPLAGVLCDVAAGRRGDRKDQAGPLRYEPGHPRPDRHCELVRDDAGHLERPHGHGNRPWRLLAPGGRPQTGQGRRVRGKAADDQGTDERPRGRVEREGATARV